MFSNFYVYAIGFLGTTTLICLWTAVYFYSHARHHKALIRSVRQATPETMSPETMAKLQQAVQENFQKLLQDSSHQFGEDLKLTSAELNEQIKRLTSDVITNELESYRTTLAGVRQQAGQALQQITAAAEQQRAAAQEQLAGEMAVEKERLVAQLDARLADIVASYLAECLGQHVDLGAQRSYLVAALEEHKDELKKDLSLGQ